MSEINALSKLINDNINASVERVIDRYTTRHFYQDKRNGWMGQEGASSMVDSYTSDEANNMVVGVRNGPVGR